MNILMVSDFYPPFLGGLERVVADLSGALKRQGHCIRVVTLWHEGMALEEDIAGVRVHRIRGTLQRLPFVFAQSERRYQPPVPDPTLVRQMARIFARFRPDVVHGHSWLMMSALPLKSIYGFATVATLHDYSLLCPKKTLLYNEDQPCTYQVGRQCAGCAPQAYGIPKGLLTSAGLYLSRSLYRNIDAFVAISSYVAAEHERWTVAAKRRVVTIPNFVHDEVLFAPPGPPLSDLPREYILYAGQLGRHKGVGVLLDAYASLDTDIPLVLIGPSVPGTPDTFPGNVLVQLGRPHAEVMRAMDHARFVVSPGLWPEPFGLVVVEAMARGKAVVASAAGGVLDIVQHEENGLLVPAGDARALSAAMRALLDEPERAFRLGQCGIARCKAHFSAGTVVSQTVELYRSVLRAEEVAAG